MTLDQLKRLIREIHRRSLWQVLLIYVGGAWGCYELIDTVTDRFGLPSWLPALAVVLFLLGLPFVLATAFVQEGISPTHRRDPTLMPAAETESAGSSAGGEGTRRLFTWRNALLGGIAALALWGVLAVGWIFFPGLGPAEREAPATPASEGRVEGDVGMESQAAAEDGRYRASVAVLAFENMGPSDDVYLSEGMTEEIIAQLAQVPRLKVISRTSAFALQNTSLTLPQIADTLGVEHVLEGSVRRIEDRARITVQLIEAETDAHLWAESYTRELVDLFEVQEEIARRVARVLVATVPELRTAAPASRTENSAAYEAYLKGRQLFHHRTRDSFLAAMDAFERSTELDPDYAPAYAGYAAVLGSWVAYG